MKDNDVITVAGAGPSGLACAITLASAGCKVVVHEWHDAVGRRFRDDFQGLENWSAKTDVLDELAGAGLTTDFEHHAVTHGTVFDTRGVAHEVHGARSLFYLVRRGSAAGTLDCELLAQARAVGVDVRFNSRVQRVEGRAVLATGPRRAKVIAVGQVFDTDQPDGAWLAFGDRLAPKGYAYLLVQGRRGTLVSCMFRNFKDEALHFDATRRFFEGRLGLRMHNPHTFGGFGYWHMPRSAMQGGHPLVGERAGFQDALAGFGMRHALRSGLLAAQSILKGTDYNRLWQAEIGPSLARGQLNRLIFAHTGARFMDLSATRLARTDAGAALARLYRPGPISRLARPLIGHLSRDPFGEMACGEDGCGCEWCKCARPARTAERNLGRMVQ